MQHYLMLTLAKLVVNPRVARLQAQLQLQYHVSLALYYIPMDPGANIEPQFTT